MSITFLQLAQRVLSEENHALTPSEIWQIAVNKGYDKLVDSNGKTPWATLGALIYVDVRDNLSTIFVPIGVRPKRFILKDQQSTLSEKEVETPRIPHTQKSDFLEKDLHPLMVYYGFYYLKAHLKTINHSKSEKRYFGEWVHPDIVGCYFPFRDWENEVMDVSELVGKSTIKLYSFELKRELSFVNLREAFFQAVSNSSWANEGYLVAANIDKEEEFMSELERLSAAFGIGVIRLDIDDPDSSEVLLPARAKDSIDWETVNKLAGMNPDFSEFLRRIKNDMRSREIRKEMYDVVMGKDELVGSFAKKKTNQ
ncbi:MAG TPA: HTH domain-containing protein [Anaerolineaceae bacterium]|nr:HTH domain-containing protein [Anaerolineaceae bacterium]